jgi:hypothetical protein
MWKYMSSEDIQNKNREIIGNYKIACGYIINNSKKVITNIQTIRPGAIVCGSFGIVYSSPDIVEAQNCLRYICTKFARVLVKTLMNAGVAIAPYRFSLVPDQDFSADSDIDWSQSTADIDAQLYKKYCLTDAEIAYIENSIELYNVIELAQEDG